MAAAPAAPDAATAVGRVHVPLGEDGAGEYTLSTLGCFDVIRAAEPLALAALDAVPAPPAAAPVTLVDYGAADAGTSLPLVHALCGRARARWPDREIAVCYEDQPTNEWRSVFGYSQGRLRLPGVPCFAEDFRDPGVFVLACGTGFHEQGFPSGSVDLGVSFTAMHWLSRLPCHLTGGPIHHTQAADPGEAAAFAEQAARDWDRILEARARELRPGGRMVVANFCVDGDGRHLGNTGGGTANMYAVMARLWGELAERGRITEAERRDCTLCNYYRTEEEVRRPFQPGGAAAEAGLKLLTCETRVTPCRYREDWLAQQRGAAGGGGGGGGRGRPQARRRAHWDAALVEQLDVPGRPGRIPRPGGAGAHRRRVLGQLRGPRGAEPRGAWDGLRALLPHLREGGGGRRLRRPRARRSGRSGRERRRVRHDAARRRDLHVTQAHFPRSLQTLLR